MASLPETAEWVDDIYQLETNDPVLGGPPNLATGEGIDNVQAQQLAWRTAYLKQAIGGLGGVAPLVPATDLNAASVTRTYMVAPGDTGSPASAYYGAVDHIEGSAGRAWQTAIMSDGRSYTRHRTDDTPTWSSWERSWNTADAQALFDVNGYRVAPDGFVTQWGRLNAAHGTIITFPMAFPNAVLSVMAIDYGGTTHSIAVETQSVSNFELRMAFTGSGNNVTTANLMSYLAIGY